MRTLEFTVNGQRLRKAPGYSFSNIVKGSKNYLKAHFTFNSSDWNGLRTVVLFKSDTDTQYLPLLNDECDIPNSVTEARTFTVQIIGVDGDLKVPTNEITVRQEEV